MAGDSGLLEINKLRGRDGWRLNQGGRGEVEVVVVVVATGVGSENRLGALAEVLEGGDSAVAGCQPVEG